MQKNLIDKNVNSEESLLFISYSRKDQDFVRSLDEALQRRKRKTWVDWKDIPFTGAWEQEIYSAIEAADAYIFVISPDSAQSEVCRKELAHAVELNKRLIPIVRRDSDPNAVPPALAALNWLFFREQDDLDKAIDALLKAIDTDLDWVRSHTRLLVRAKEWTNNNQDKSFVLRGSDLKEAESWLQEGSGKEPKPTDLHIEYLTASRRAATTRRRIVVSTVAVGLVVAITLATIAIKRSVEANEQRQEAEKQQKEADIARQVAVARRLVSQAQVIKNQQGNLLELAVLLVIESMRRVATLEADQFLRENVNHLSPHESKLTLRGSVDGVSFSPEGKYLTTVSSDDLVQVWEAQTGQSVATMKHAPGTTLAKSADQKYIATGSTNGLVQIWDSISGKEVIRLNRQKNVRTIAFSPDGQSLAIGTDDGPLTISSISTGQEVAQLTTEGSVVSVAYSMDGKYLAAATSFGQLYIWDAVNRTQLAQQPVEFAEVVVSELKFSPNSKYLASAGFSSLDGVQVPAQIREASSGRVLATLSGEGNVEHIAFSNDGSYLAGASGDSAKVWNVPDGRKIVEVKHRSVVLAVALSDDARYLATGSGDNSAAVWELSTGHEIIRLRHNDAVTAVAFTPDGKHFATGSSDKTAAFWSLPGQGKNVTFGDKLYITSASFSRDGNYLATRATESDDQDVARVWLTSSGRQLTTVHHDRDVYATAINNDYLLTGSGDKTARIWHLPDGSELKRLTHDYEVQAVAFSPDGKYVATGTSGGGKTVRLWDANTGAELRRFEHGSAIIDLAFSTDSRRLASVSLDKTTRVWKVDTGEEVVRLDNEIAPDAVTFSPDGTFLATSGFGVTVSEISTRRSIVVSKDQQEQTRVVKFSPDGKYLATVDEHAIHVWELSTSDAREVARIPRAGDLFDLTFSSNGEYLTGATTGLTLESWHWRSEDMVADACTHVSRNLSREEWSQYFGQEPYRATCEQRGSTP